MEAKGKGLTKKQEKAYEKIHAANLLLCTEFGLDESEEVTQENLLRIQGMRIRRAAAILGDSPVLSKTTDIIKHVKENY